MQRYYIFFIWQNVFHSFLFSLSFSSLLISLSSSLSSVFLILPLFSFFPYSLLNIIAHVGVCLHMSASTRMYIIRSVDGTKYGQVFNTVKNETFFLKYLVVSKIVSTFALAFEKSSIPQGDKERVL